MFRMGGMRGAGQVLLFLVLWGAAAPSQASQEVASPVGVPAWQRDLVLEGSELEVAPSTHATPVVLRIAAVYPHGSAFRYDIEYYGLEAGTFDLLDFLERKDGSSLEDLAAVPVIIRSTLPPGTVRPNALEEGSVPGVGGYKVQMWILGILWVAGLWAILTMGRKRHEALEAARSAPQTLAERLRPLVERGIAGRLSREESAELELTLIAFWRRKLALHDKASVEALEFLRGHAEAGPLLRQLELWLHSPGSAADVDVTRLLVPYQRLAADALETEVATEPV